MLRVQSKIYAQGKSKWVKSGGYDTYRMNRDEVPEELQSQIDQVIDKYPELIKHPISGHDMNRTNVTVYRTLHHDGVDDRFWYVEIMYCEFLTEHELTIVDAVHAPGLDWVI